MLESSTNFIKNGFVLFSLAKGVRYEAQNHT